MMKHKLQSKLLLLSLLIQLLSINIFGQIKQASFTTGSGTNQMDLVVTLNQNTNLVTMTMSGPATKWFGFAFNVSSMSSAYTILSNIGGNNPKEYSMSGQFAPSLQSNQNLNFVSLNTTNGRKTYIVSRAFNTQDVNDLVFSMSMNSLDIIWAYGNGTSLAYHDDRGNGVLSFVNPCAGLSSVLPTSHICAGDSLQIFGIYQKVTGTYSDTISLSSGCDSIITKSLVVHNVQNINLLPKSICSGDSILIFGEYRKNAGIFKDTLLSQYGCDSIVSQVLNVGSSISYNSGGQTICFGDSISIFGIYRSTSGVYFDTLIANSGCDSIVSFSLTVNNPIDTTVQIQATTLEAVAGADNYQWFDCNTNIPVNGAVSSSFTPTQNGLYKVKITKNSCDAFSSCHYVGNIGIEYYIQELQKISIYPIPTSDVLQIETSSIVGKSEILIYAMDGRIVKTLNLNEGKIFQVDVHDLEDGFYYVRLRNKDVIGEEKFIVKKR